MTGKAKSLPLPLKTSQQVSYKKVHSALDKANKSPSAFIHDAYDKKLDVKSSKFYKANKVKPFLKKSLLNKYYDFNKREKYYSYIKHKLDKYLPKSTYCLTPMHKDNYDGHVIEDVVYLDKQIGSSSRYGVIFKAFVKNTIGGTPIAAKFMQAIESNMNELKINEEVSTKILAYKLSPHFLFTFKHFECVLPSPSSYSISSDWSSSSSSSHMHFDKVMHQDYYIALNEIAHGDLKMLMTDKSVIQDQELMFNLACQCMLAIATFHKFGYLHKDCHWGNFLYHKINPSDAYYHYRINKKDYYLKNCGYNMMIYDFGKAKPYHDSSKSDVENSVKDYTRIAKAFMQEAEGGWIDDYLDSNVLISMYMSIMRKNMNKGYYNHENEIIQTVALSFSRVLKTDRPAKVLNMKPYVI